MPDMLVNLLKLPSLDRLNDEGINIRRAQPFEITPVREFIERELLSGLGRRDLSWLCQ